MEALESKLLNVPGGGGGSGGAGGISSEVQTELDRLEALINSPNPNPDNTILLTGGAVAHDGGLNIAVGASTYLIQGEYYESAATTLTASAADETHARYDVVALNTSGEAVLIEGTPAANPVKPEVDPASQLELTFIHIAAEATTPTVSIENIYLENTEWTMSQSGGHVTLNSTNGERNGSVSIEATAMVANDYFQAQNGSNVDLADWNSLVFWIDNKAAWPGAKRFSITARLNGVAVGTPVVVANGQYGFDSTSTSYHAVAVPLNLFGADGLAVNQFRWTLVGGGASVGFFVDDITLQGGIGAITDATRMRWKGVWASGAFYQTHDTVKRNGLPYVAVQSGVGNDPETSSTFWEPVQDRARADYFAADAGANDTYTATLLPAPTAYVTGAAYRFKANTANTGAATINFNSLGAITIKKSAGGITTDLATNDIRAGQWVDLVYDGTNMQMQSLLGNAPASGSVDSASNVGSEAEVFKEKSGTDLVFRTIKAGFNISTTQNTNDITVSLSPPTVIVYRAANQNVNTSSDTPIQFDTETRDTLGLHSLVSNTSRITIGSSSAGLWFFTFSCVYSINATGTRFISLYKNGSVITPNIGNSTVGGANTVSVFAAGHVELSDGDYVEIVAWQNSGSTLTVTGSISGARVSA